MGFAQVLSSGGGGRYTVRLDYGEALRAAIVAALQQLRANLENMISTLDVKIAAAQALEDAAKAQADALAQDYINGQIGAGQPPLSTQTIQRMTQDWQAQRAEFIRLQADRRPLQIQRDATALALADVLQRIQSLEATVTIETRTAWCIDYTENASGTVGTLEINGESELIVLAAGGRAYNPVRDGALTAREIMSPAQVYFNAAILPGWQRFVPGFRWGTLTGIDYDANTADVSLAPATSSAQGLDINVVTTLPKIPVRYMTCNAQAFEVGDRVVVEMLGNNWGACQVIGFLDNPKPCVIWTGLWRILGHPDYASGGYYTLSDQDKRPGQTWDAVVAPAEVAGVSWRGWSDGQLSTIRADGVATRHIDVVGLYLPPPYLEAVLLYALDGPEVQISIGPGGVQQTIRVWLNYTVTWTISRSSSSHVGYPYTALTGPADAGASTLLIFETTVPGAWANGLDLQALFFDVGAPFSGSLMYAFGPYIPSTQTYTFGGPVGGTNTVAGSRLGAVGTVVFDQQSDTRRWWYDPTTWTTAW